MIDFIQVSKQFGPQEKGKGVGKRVSLKTGQPENENGKRVSLENGSACEF